MGKLLFRIARFKIVGAFVGFAFAHFPFLVPIRKILCSKKAISFAHPVAVYPEHVLIIPRKIARTVFHLSSDDFEAILEMAVKIRYGDNRDFVVMINGGRRQDVMQAHFHLFTENLATEKGLAKKIDSAFSISDLRSILKQHQVPEESFSLVVQFEKGAEPVMYLMQS